MKRSRSTGQDLEHQWDYKTEMEELNAALPEINFKKEITEPSDTLPEVKFKREIIEPSATLPEVNIKKEITELNATLPEVNIKKEITELNATLPEVNIKKEITELNATLPEVNIKKEITELNATLPEVNIKKEITELNATLPEDNFKKEIAELSTTLPAVNFKKEIAEPSATLPVVNFKKEIADPSATLPEVNFKKEIAELSTTLPEVYFKQEIADPSATLSVVNFKKEIAEPSATLPVVNFKKEITEPSDTLPEDNFKTEIVELSTTLPAVNFKKEIADPSATLPEVYFKTEIAELSTALPEVYFKKEITELNTTLPEVKFKTDRTSRIQPLKDYRPRAHHIPLEMSEKRLKILCEIKLRELQINSIEEIERIQRSTVGQHGKSRYDDLRRDRLTASQFGMVCKRRSSTPYQNHVRRILYPSNFSNFDMIYGLTFEIYAIKLFERTTGKTVEPAGLFIDREYGFLGASPDGLVVGEDSLVEVKCFPSLARAGMSVARAARRKKGFPLYVDHDGELELNRRHNFYYQIQGQMRVCRKTRCYLVAFVNIETPITILVIEKDNEFIETMVEKLVDFYKSYVLPELVLRFSVDANATWMYG